MRYINHLSDFQVIINIKDKEGNIIAPPSVPWEAVFADENGVEFKCYYDGNNYTHCIVDFSDIVCFIDNPGFACGKLRCTFCQHVPSAEYCDGVMDLTQPLQCDIMLSKRESDDSTPITIEASPNWVRGPQGEQGIQGPQGIKGDKGERGEKGDKGDTGAKGDQGEKGDKGEKGDTGEKGERGEKGDRGERGLQGVQGVKGDDGVSPTVTTSKTGKVTTIEITDAQGTHTATVNDGESVEVVQSTGTSETAVMSQKASTDSFAANTPSGDPAHFLYESAGAKWNADTGLWTLGSYSDLTTEEIRYAFANKVTYINNSAFGLYHDYKSRCIFPSRIYGPGVPIVFDRCLLNSKIREFQVNSMGLTSRFQIARASDYAFSSENLVKISCALYVSRDTSENARKTLFSGCKKLEYIRVNTTYSGLYLNDSPLLSKESVLSMINGSKDGNTVTHTLHPDVYAKCVEGGEWFTEIQTALANKTNVSLAKGE